MSRAMWLPQPLRVHAMHGTAWLTVIVLHFAGWMLLERMQSAHAPLSAPPVLMVRMVEPISANLELSKPEPMQEKKPEPAREAVATRKSKPAPAPVAVTQDAIAEQAPTPLLVAPATPANVPFPQNAPAAVASTPTTTPTTQASPKTVSEVEYIEPPQPNYPNVSQRLGEEGKVVLRVLVNVEGKPEEAHVRISSGFARLDEAARNAALRARFRPYRDGNAVVPVWTIIPISFSLRG
jgi:periplasmic protein TonB